MVSGILPVKRTYLKKHQQRCLKPSGSDEALLAELRQLWGYLSRRRQTQLGLLLLLLLLTTLSEMVSLGTIFPFLMALGNAENLLQTPRLQPILSLFRIETSQQLVTGLALGFIGAVVIANGLRLFTLRVQVRLSAAIAADLSSQIYHVTLRQPYTFHVRHNSSELIQTVTDDINRLTNNILIPLLAFVSNVVLVPGLIVTLVLIDSTVALSAAVLLGGTYTLIYRIRQQLLQQNGQIIAQSGQRKIKVVQEGIGGIRDVLLDQSQGFFEQEYRLAERTNKQAGATNVIIAQSPRFLVEALSLSAIALLALGLGRDGDFSQAVPVLGSFALGAKRLLPAVQELFATLAVVQGARASLVRVRLALQRSVDPLLAQPITLPPLPLRHELRLEDVWFRYGEELDWVLHGLDLKIAAKTTVAFVGSTGSGKSTTADVILGLLQPERGAVLVDGKPLEGLRLLQWQRGIAHVPQHIFLSDGTMAENIAFGVARDQIDRAQVEKAARMAQIADFIEGLPAGYDSIVGERGIRLSGGQRQRIGIARALYRRASVMVLDEATSALDNATEREVMGAIEALSGELTIILIAHRLSTVERCDLVVELSQGRVVAQGTYGELLERSVSFRQMAALG